MNKFKSYWWKVLGVLLVLYSVYRGTSAKVGPGIVQVTPDLVHANSDFEITVEGYNTHFDHFLVNSAKGNGVGAWLKLDTILVLGRTTILDDNHVKIAFDGFDLKTDTTFTRSATIVLEDDHHGLFLGSQMLRVTVDPDSLASQDVLTSTKNLPYKLDQTYFSFPYRYILYETIRNLNFHVPMWFVMMTLLFISFVFSIRHLNTKKALYDIWANGFAKAGLLFGLMGIATGMFWANYTWGTPWTNDAKLNGAAVGVLMYIAYQILRSSIDDEDMVARVSAVYNIFAYPIFIVLIIVLPRLADFSLHPGAGDSVGFSNYDLNNHLRTVFYPAVLGWIVIGVWVGQLTTRIDRLEKEEEWNS